MVVSGIALYNIAQAPYPSSIMKDLLHLKVVQCVRSPKLHVVFRFLTRETSGVESDETVAHRPVLYRLVQYTRVTEDNHLVHAYSEDG